MNHLPGGKDLTQLAIGGFSETANEGVGFGLGFASTMDQVATGTPGRRRLLLGRRGLDDLLGRPEGGPLGGLHDPADAVGHLQLPRPAQEHRLLRRSSTDASALLTGRCQQTLADPVHRPRDTPWPTTPTTTDDATSIFLYGRWPWPTAAERRAASAARLGRFAGTSFCQGLMGGLCNVDENDFRERGFQGLTFRTFDVETRQWSIYWVNAASGALQAPVFGRFENGDRPLLRRGRRRRPSGAGDLRLGGHHAELGPLDPGLLLRRRPRPGRRTGSWSSRRAGPMTSSSSVPRLAGRRQPR